MRKYLIIIIILILSLSVNSQIPNNLPGFQLRVFTTPTMRLNLTNLGSLGRDDSGYSGIFWNNYSDNLVYNHGLWITGISDDQVVGSVPHWIWDYSPGPIINNQAAMQISPEDSLKYGVYIISNNSDDSEPDYQGWPVQWGAPINNDGSPHCFGASTYYIVYNDAHTGAEYEGYLPHAPTPIEIHETGWYYDNINELDNVIFFKYQVYNKGTNDFDSTTLSLWTDIDINAARNNQGGYNSSENFLYMYSAVNPDRTIPLACAYVLLQGPLTESWGDSGLSFNKYHQNYKNLPTTAGWHIIDDYSPLPSDFLCSMPYALTEMRNVTLGLKRYGDPIINPVTGMTTTFTYDGDPVSGAGWIDTTYNGGGAGFITSSGPFKLSAGDSTEAIFAFLAVTDTLYKNAIISLEEEVHFLRTWWANQNQQSINLNKNTNPKYFKLFPTYPNPFNASTTIKWYSNSNAFLEIKVFDLNGREVEKIWNRNTSTGENFIIWNNHNLCSGIYLIVARQSNSSYVQKCLIIK